jgi:hypothetical protein
MVPKPVLSGLTLLSLLALLAGLTGCTGSSGGSSAAAGSGTTGSSASAPSVPVPSSTIVNEPSARKDVTAGACTQTSSGWKMSGTVTNSGSQQAAYTIVVSFTTKQSTVLARGTTKVTVKAGATKGWTASASFAKTEGVQCVLRGVARVA